MRVKKVSIYIRLCDQPGRPFERLKVRNPRQCGKRDYYCLRVGGKFEFFAEQDAARKDLNEALHRKGEREHELRIGVAAPLIPQRTVAQPGKTPVADAVQKHFDNLEAMGKDPKTIRTYRAAVNGFLASYKKPFIEDYERQHLIDYMGWLRKQPRKQRKHANPDRTYFNKVSHVAIFLKACGVRPDFKPASTRATTRSRWSRTRTRNSRCSTARRTKTSGSCSTFLSGLMVRDHEAQMAKYSDLTGTTLTVHGKQHKTRTVEISQRLALAIRERGEAATKNGGSELLFPNGNGRPNTHLLDVLQGLAERAGAKFHTELHKLRKTGASRRYRAGELLTTLMQELGHEDLSSTQRYLSDVKPET